MSKQNRDHGNVVSRREWISRTSAAVTAVGAALVGAPVLAFLLGPLLERVARKWRVVGSADGFSVGTTVRVQFEDASPLPWSGVVAHTAAWVRRESENDFVAFSVNCTHLGCPVRWLEGPNLFLCPCHGGVYYENGDVAAGPPPRALTRYPVRLRRGKVEILTSPVPIG